MAVDEIGNWESTSLGAEGGGEVVGLELALKATLELEQRAVLDEK